MRAALRIRFELVTGDFCHFSFDSLAQNQMNPRYESDCIHGAFRLDCMRGKIFFANVSSTLPFTIFVEIILKCDTNRHAISGITKARLMLDDRERSEWNS